MVPFSAVLRRGESGRVAREIIVIVIPHSDARAVFAACPSIFAPVLSEFGPLALWLQKGEMRHEMGLVLSGVHGDFVPHLRLETPPGLVLRRPTGSDFHMTSLP